MRKLLTIHLLFCALLFTVFVSCKKEIIEPDSPQTENVIRTNEMPTAAEFEERVDNVYHILSSSGIKDFKKITWDEVYIMMKEALLMKKKDGDCYDTSDLLGLLTEYGTITPDYIPTWNNYIQDVNCNLPWNYIGHERNPETGNGFSSDIVSDAIVWNLDGATTTTYEAINDGNLYFQTYMLDPDNLIDTVPNTNPSCTGTFQPPVNGGHATTLTVHIGSATFERSAIGWAQINSVPESIAPYFNGYGSGYSEISGTYDWMDCSCPIVFTPYQFLINDGLVWDLSGDHAVDATDLLILLAGYGC